MKFYEFVEYSQRENPNKVVMVRNGVFYNEIGRDVIILERVLGFKRTCHARFLCKCGMPVYMLKKILKKLKND